MQGAFQRKIDSFYHRCPQRILIFVSFFIFIPLVSSAQKIRFRDVTLEMNARGWVVNGISVYGHGAAFADISGDSLPDLYISNAVRGANNKLPETLYISHAGRPYTEEDGLRGVSDKYGLTGSHGICFADYDNDGDLDIFNATTDDRVRLYRNRGDGYFSDVSDAAKITPARVFYPTYGYVGYGTRGIVCFDADNDGDLDLYAVNWGPVEDADGNPWETPPQPNEFYLNNGDGTFTKDDSRGLTPLNPSYMGSQGVVALDIDEDGDMDVLVCHRNYAYLGLDAYGNKIFGPGPTPTPNDLFINEGNGYFTKANIQERGLYWEANDCNGVTFADYDNDGDLDAFVVPKDSHRKYVRVYKNDGKGFFKNVTSTTAIEQWGFTCFVFDADNDGFLDVFTPITRGEAGFYQNDQKGGFIRVEGTGLNIEAYDPRGGGVADIDGDGDLDLFYCDANKEDYPQYSNRLFRNETITTNKWVKIWGTGPKGDMGAFGTKIWVFDKGYMDDMTHLLGYKQVMNAYGYLAQDDLVQHFGIGLRDSVDVKIKMLDGTVLKTRVRANVRFYFSKPQKITKVDGDNQEGRIGEPLPIPFRIRVQDAKDKAVAGVGMKFEVIQGEGRFVEKQPVYTDHAGIARATYVIGNYVGEHRIRVSSESISGEGVVFVVTAKSIGPTNLELVSGEGQSAYTGSVLGDSIRVRVVDSFGQGQAGHPVKFEVKSGNGRLKPGDVQILERLTNSAGLVAVAWQLGQTPSEAQILHITSSASFGPLIGSPIDVHATALPRPINAGKPKELVYREGNQQTGVVGQLLTKPFVVQLVDSIGQGCPDYDVLFQITAGGGHFQGADQYIAKTDQDGLASVYLWLGTIAGTNNQRVQVSYSGLATKIIFTATALADTPAVLVKKDGDNQSAKVNNILSKPLIVGVTDRYGNAIEGHPVSFSVTSSDGWVNDQKNITTFTDREGEARVFLRFGSTPGFYTVSVSAHYNHRPLLDSPALFTATAVSLPAFLHKISADSSFGVAGQPVPEPIRLKITDDLGYPVPNYAVNFVVRRGGGHIDNRLELLKITDVNGIVTVTPTLGPDVGAYNNVFEAQAYREGGQNLNGSPKRYYVSAKKSLATKLERLNNEVLSAQAGDFLPQPLGVRVLDYLSRPVAGHDVTFEVVAGGGKLSKTQTNIITIKTDDNGVAQVSFRLGDAVGLGAHVVRVTSDDGITQLSGSPLFINISAPYGQPDVVRSEVSFDSPVVADGMDECLVKIKLMDKYGNPVPNERVTLLAQGNGNVISQPEFVTDANGETVAILRSTIAEDKRIRIYVVDDGVFLAKEGIVRFIPGPPSRIFLEQGNYQNGVINSVVKETLGVRIFDFYDNPIANAEVFFLPFPNSGRVEPAEKQITNSEGRAFVSWILGPTIGLQQLQVRVSGMVVTENFSAYAAPPSELTLTKMKGEGQFATPGTIFPDSLVVKIVNGHQSPIAGLDITFTVLQGDAMIIGTPTVKSDSYGMARACLLAGMNNGAVKIRAAVAADIFIDFYCTVAASLPQKLILVYGNGLTAPVLSLVYPLSVRVTDSDDQPVANVPIYFSCETNDGLVEEAQPVLTDNNGLASATAKLGAQAGEYLFRASNPALVGSPITFRIIATPAAVARIHVYEGNNQTARALQTLASPIKVRLSDLYNNGVPNQEVMFEVTAGGGSVYPLSIHTDKQGIAGTVWRLGSSGYQEVKAITQPLVGQAAFFTAMVIENIPPVIRCLSDTVILETQTLVFDVDAFDPDGGMVSLSCLNPPDGATYDAIHTTLFIWRPEFHQQGVYVIIFRAVDSEGGTTTKTVAITVQNLNRPPLIYGFQPENFYISTTAFKPIKFYVSAADPDNDSLRYRWSMDSRVIGNNREMTLFPTPNMPAQFMVSATVDDNIDSVSQEWMINLQTGVELSYFRVEGVQGCNRLSWSGRLDDHHLGFNVLRSKSLNGPFEKLNDRLIERQDQIEYVYIDRPTDTGVNYFYQLQSVDANGGIQIFGPIEAAAQIPDRICLLQNYPNPFNPITTLIFEIPKAQMVEINIYNLSGQLVRRLYRQDTKPGYHQIAWDGCSDEGVRLPSGIYYAVMQTEGLRQSIKCVMIK